MSRYTICHSRSGGSTLRMVTTLCILIAATSACREAAPTGTVQQQDGVAVTPPTADVTLGQTVRLSAELYVEGSTVPNQTFTWWTPDASVATVDANGVVSAVGLGTVRFGVNDDRSGGRTGQIRDKSWSAEFLQRSDHFLNGWFALKFDRNAFRVTVANRHTITLRADDQRRVHDPILSQLSEELERFALHLFLLSTDVWHDVVQDVR